ncbi:MAG: cyclopropane-fatty-acyl-phospholipid synthase family protein [Candidatus Coatesbacteria bacterium]
MKKLYHSILSGVRGTPFAVRYPDGSTVAYGGEGTPKFTLVLRTEAAMRAIMVNVDLGFGEAYMYGALDIEGELLDFLMMALTSNLESELRRVSGQPTMILRHLPSYLRVFWQALYQPHTYETDKRYISEPYDLGNDFYAKWLDKDVLYSCGYFKTPDDSIDAAQEQKREHVCRKALLKPGETLLDIGCGWGGLLIWAAQHHGISGVGVTLSKEQAAFGNLRIKEAGLGDKIHVEHCHWQDIEKWNKVFDKVVSVGCLEHVGKKWHDRFFGVVKKSLNPKGTFVLHTIGKQRPGISLAFGNKYIFPGVYTATLVEIATCLEKQGMRVQDVENLRLHYSLTCRRWAADFEAHADEFRAQYGDPFVRMFRLYLVNGIAMMAHADNELFQVVATPGIDNVRPLTRDYLYRA